MFSGKKILLGVTGSIAAYKAVIFVRLLVKAGAEVKVIMTPAAHDFVSPLTFSTLSKNKVLTIYLMKFMGKSCDAWTMGRCNDDCACSVVIHYLKWLLAYVIIYFWLFIFLQLALLLLAPAMDEDMWHHPATKSNYLRFNAFGNKILPVNNGELASGLIGEGRMAEPEKSSNILQDFFLKVPDLKV